MNDNAASLVFDSWVESTPWLRGRAFEDRHLIYEDGGIILDLLLKQADEGASIHVAGQLLPAEDALDVVAELPVLLDQNGRRSFTHTNALGEFTFHLAPGGSFDIAITLKDRRFNVHGLSNNDPRRWRIVATTVAGGA
jgi:hypothetical protein